MTPDKNLDNLYCIHGSWSLIFVKVGFILLKFWKPSVPKFGSIKCQAKLGPTHTQTHTWTLLSRALCVTKIARQALVKHSSPTARHNLHYIH